MIRTVRCALLLLPLSALLWTPIGCGGDSAGSNGGSANGNNGAGSGAIEFAAMVMAQHRNTVPPSVNTDPLDEACRFRFVQNDPTDAPIDHAISLGHAFAGGQAGALVTRRYQE